MQELLDSYESGINVVRVNFDKADPPEEVISAFRDVQTARQERDRLEREADAYANRVLAEARGKPPQLREEAEGYRAAGGQQRRRVKPAASCRFTPNT